MIKESKDPLGDRMKEYERRETGRAFFQTLPIYARIDGRGFSRFTKGMDRPHDQRLTDAMIEVTKYLVKETHARIGYTQSDEISLVFMTEDFTQNLLFKGKIQKLTSVLASLAAAKLAWEIRDWSPYNSRLPAFDARVLQLPDIHEAANMILWRTLDARRNAVSMAAQALYSHRQLQGVKTIDLRQMIADKGVDLATYPGAFLHGTFARRTIRESSMTKPAQHKFHKQPDEIIVRRTLIDTFSVPSFQSVDNRTGFLFNGEEHLHREFP